MPCRKPKKYAKFGPFEVGAVLAIVLAASLMLLSHESTYTATVVSDKLTYSKLWSSWTYPITISGLEGTYAMEATAPFAKGQAITIKVSRWNIKHRLVHSPGY